MTSPFAVFRAENSVPSWVVLVHFAYLQVMDLLSTLAFLLSGVREGNPVVRLAIEGFGDPIRGIAAVKAAAVMLALGCIWTGRARFLGRVNVFYAFLLAWNLCCLIIGLTQRLHP